MSGLRVVLKMSMSLGHNIVVPAAAIIVASMLAATIAILLLLGATVNITTTRIRIRAIGRITSSIPLDQAGHRSFLVLGCVPH
jgi:hypothetical protein